VLGIPRWVFYWGLGVGWEDQPCLGGPRQTLVLPSCLRNAEACLCVVGPCVSARRSSSAAPTYSATLQLRQSATRRTGILSSTAQNRGSAQLATKWCEPPQPQPKPSQRQQQQQEQTYVDCCRSTLAAGSSMARSWNSARAAIKWCEPRQR
jgi:hypothetical protein